ncbi:MAG: ComEA family DNA-binding protein [Microcella sp.]|uniref:ComEA family DNA-binding protein n=1 Tax=Microcella sp. TaxID=1913979 RepID=UPI003315FFEE
MSELSSGLGGESLRRGVRVRAAVTGVVVLSLLGVGAAVVAAIVTPGGEVVAVGEAGAAGGGADDARADGAGGDAALAPPGEPGVLESSPEAARLVLHVHGAVADPGIVELPAGARVVDAIAAARGPTDDADLGGVNLARLVVDGEQLYVPRVGEVPPPGAAAPDDAGGSSSTLVNINTADAAALETLPGIGPALAGRIIAWRQANGGFRAVDELLAVSGIGQTTLDGFRDQVTL